MALVSEHLCSLFSNVVPRRKVRRRPKLVPPKNKRFTRARINLNNLWPHLEGGESEVLSATTPLQSSNNCNIRRNQQHQDLRTSTTSLQGNELFNYTLQNIENLNNFDHIPLECEYQRKSEDNLQGNVRDSLLQSQIHFYTSCSNINFKRTFEKISPPSSPRIVNLEQQRRSESLHESNHELPPMITLDDLATVLGECEEVIYAASTSSEARSAKRTRLDDSNSDIAAAVERGLLGDSQPYHNVQLMQVESAYEQRQQQHQDLHRGSCEENVKENEALGETRDYRVDCYRSADVNYRNGITTAATTTTTTDNRLLTGTAPSLLSLGNMLQY